MEQELESILCRLAFKWLAPVTSAVEVGSVYQREESARHAAATESFVKGNIYQSIYPLEWRMECDCESQEKEICLLSGKQMKRIQNHRQGISLFISGFRQIQNSLVKDLIYCTQRLFRLLQLYWAAK